MPILTFIKNDERIKIEFEGTPLLRDVLVESDFYVDSPCGGKGICKKCKARVSGAVSTPNQTEMDAKCRLICQVRLFGDAEAEPICDENKFINIETQTLNFKPSNLPDWKYGVAIDIGTTTVVLSLYDNSGKRIATASSLNPQNSFSSDVIGRIDASLHGNAEKLKEQITSCITELLKNACEDAQIEPNEVQKTVITGNTAMLYLYTGRNPESISQAPFEADTLFGEYLEDDVYLAPCMNAFVGGDITCAVLASQMCESDKVSLICDIGTNGEIALWKNGRLYVTSAAAGPAFEGGEISCGCGCISGAVDRVIVKNGNIEAFTTDNSPAKGICGSGLISAVSAMLELGYIDESGYGENIPPVNANGGSVQLTQDDIRALQLAKAAIAAAIEMLLKHTKTNIDEINNLYISGGFGNRLSLLDSARIGLIPNALISKAKLIGNAALSGAIYMLFDENYIEKAEIIAKESTHISLAGETDFYESFIKNINFAK